MCGIVGYVGSDQAAPVLIEGLRRLEYRGYDSAGMSILDGGGRLATVKAPGKLRMLEARLAETPLPGSCGIGHTRWATHGAPSTANAHPHTSTDGTIAVVHNGIIENARRLRQDLEAAGAVFRSETDTEVIAHLVDRVWPEGGALEDAVAGALGQITGAYGIAVVSSRDPDKIVVARHGSPLLVGIGEREMMVASDASAVIGHTRNVVYLDDGDYVVVQPDGYRARHLHLGSVHRPIHTVTWDVRAVGKGGYEHFMLKEIFEQPKTLEDVMRGRLLGESGDARLGGITGAEQVLQDVERVILTACGTSWHAALIGEYMLEELARIPTKVEYASEFRYKNPVVDRKTLIVAISQSGETADTLAAIREAKRRGAPLMGIVNVVGSSIARETDFGMYLHAGPEIGVASTKAFTSQVAALAMFTLHLARCRSLPLVAGRELVRSLRSLPERVEEILGQNDAIRALAEEFRDAPNFLYLGRGVQFPVALEGALKLKEVSYIHAEGYPAAEMKHGPIALIDAQMPVVFLAPRDPVYHKVVSNIEEVKARSGRIVAVVNNGAAELAGKVDHFIPVPTTHPALLPILTVVPLQLLAYHISVLRGCDVDQPRNLAKSVTVE
ncbi:MAG: glutamine--fructose-6-phosphate transaminase (isomerizing) [Gammaproteobacteria bacterium]|nr:glutamine--fructose-6-phosphate transaminase (isomerizing) [Gammaproteobacteria bacterium]MDE0248470.1 glutamine--fructose-6-phosphate transaminase (isomerizing) [Gammaproteobacteria bacterium]